MDREIVTTISICWMVGWKERDARASAHSYTGLGLMAVPRFGEFFTALAYHFCWLCLQHSRNLGTTF